MFFKKILYYLNPANLFHRDEEAGISLRMMHGVNKISFLMFLVCLVVMLVRWFGRCPLRTRTASRCRGIPISNP